jgi:hypothetical protein
MGSRKLCRLKGKVSADIVVKGNGLEVGGERVCGEGFLLLSTLEWRRLLLFYSREVVRGFCRDYNIEYGKGWVHFSLMGEVQGQSVYSIGKHRVGRGYDYFLYEGRRVLKKGKSVDEMIRGYYMCLGLSGERFL